MIEVFLADVIRKNYQNKLIDKYLVDKNLDKSNTLATEGLASLQLM